MHLIYITLPTKDEAIKIANKLVKDRLVACVNIHDGVTSIYEWEGKIQQNQEITLICKTSDESVDNVIKMVTKKHPYACPCIIAINIEKGNEDFLTWVENYCKAD